MKEQRDKTDDPELELKKVKSIIHSTKIEQRELPKEKLRVGNRESVYSGNQVQSDEEDAADL